MTVLYYLDRFFITHLMRLPVCAAVIALMAMAASAAGYSNGWNPSEGPKELAPQRSGYVSISTGAHTFYWLFESRSRPEQAPLVIWLTGGPGCSSELAIFYEQGPFGFDDSGDIRINKYAWNQVANVLFVDQPRSTGFSYVDGSSDEQFNIDEKSIADDLFEFLQGFMRQFPEYADREVFITGESYAGHYVPVFAGRVLKGNRIGEGLPIALKGIAIGNGWVNARYQFPAMVEYALEHGLIVDDEDKRNDLRIIAENCQQQLDADPNPTLETFRYCALIENYLIGDPSVQSRPFNYYDIRRDCGPYPECYDFHQLDRLLEQEDVLSSLGVSPRADWVDCDPDVWAHLITDQQLACDAFIPDLLDAGLRVLIYSGVEDFLCNHLGTEAWLSAMPWSGQQGLRSQTWTSWFALGEEAGRFKQTQNLLVVEVAESGHMVPMDQPERALELVKSLLGEFKLDGPPSLAID